MDTAKKHQMKIARDTLKMTPAAARIMGGMTHEEAYHLIFHQDLRSRLTELIEKYPDCLEPNSLNTELCAYGWSGIKDLTYLLANL